MCGRSMQDFDGANRWTHDVELQHSIDSHPLSCASSSRAARSSSSSTAVDRVLRRGGSAAGADTPSLS